MLLSSCIWHFISRHTTTETAQLQLYIPPGCCLWDAPWQLHVPFNFLCSDQALEPDLPTTCLLAGFLDTNSPSINSLQKWYPTTLLPSSLPAPVWSVQKSVKQLTRLARQGWRKPTSQGGSDQECTLRSWGLR